MPFEEPNALGIGNTLGKAEDGSEDRTLVSERAVDGGLEAHPGWGIAELVIRCATAVLLAVVIPVWLLALAVVSLAAVLGLAVVKQPDRVDILLKAFIQILTPPAR
jgi:hypothetical protein